MSAIALRVGESAESPAPSTFPDGREGFGILWQDGKSIVFDHSAEALASCCKGDAVVVAPICGGGIFIATLTRIDDTGTFVNRWLPRGPTNPFEGFGAAQVALVGRVVS